MPLSRLSTQEKIIWNLPSKDFDASQAKRIVSMLIDCLEICKFLERAVDHYERTAPTVYDYCDGLYRRINKSPTTVSLQELLTVQQLQQDSQWMMPSYAANRIYHLMSDLGIDTTGHAGF